MNEHSSIPETELAARVPVTPQAMESLRLPADVNISPDGQRVAFVVREWDTDSHNRRGHIWMVETTPGSEPQPFSKGMRDASCPRWSPDGQQLAFIATLDREGSKEKSKPQLYLMPANGGEAKSLCTMPNGVSDLEWSPDGTRIAFLSLEGEEPGTDPLVVRPQRHRRLWTIRTNYDIPEPVTPDGLTVWEYVWSPDSQSIALYYSEGSDDTDWYRGQIGVIAARGGAVRQLTHLTRQACALTWSHDSMRLAYISGEWSDPYSGGGDILVLSLESGEVRNLTPSIPFSPSWCRWFPDDRHLLYTAWSGVTQHIGVIDEVDGSIMPLTQDFVMAVNWPHLSTTPDMRTCATIHMDSRLPPDAWLGELIFEEESATDIEWRRLSQLNPIAEETFAVVPSERIRYESVDGWQIDALFTPPLNAKSDGPPPLVVNVHGGPSWAWLDDFGMLWTQVLASAGYAVLRPNVRGSWGRGVAFADAVIGDMGGKDLQDILHGVDYLVQQGLVDGKRVAIAGGSYGGFMTAWAVTQTTRFKAAIMVAGVSDFHSFHAQSRLKDWDMRFLEANPLEHPEVYREHSAITYAARVRTPTLILHGENDQDVPVNQAYAFYYALRERGVPTELVIYPREGHGLHERNHRSDCTERILKWLERYL